MDNRVIDYDILDERRAKKERNTYGTYKFQCIDQVSKKYDLVIVPVNSYQLCDALIEINQQVPSARYLIMSLNWIGASEIDAIIRPEQYVMGYAGGGGTLKDKNSILWGNIGNDVMLGCVYEAQNSLLRDVNALFLESGITPEIPSNVLHALWLQNVASAPFGAAFSKHKDIMKTFADKELVRVCFKAFRECYDILSARGVNLKDFPEAKMFSLLFKLPISIQLYMLKKNLSGEAAQRYTSHALFALDEMKNNFAQILDTARELNVYVPNMEKLNSLI